MRYLIIGNGAAGTAAAQKLRQLDSNGEITILTAEGPDAYSKCLLSDYLFADYREANLHFKEADFYQRHRIKVFSKEQVMAIDFGSKSVSTLPTGATRICSNHLQYDKLLIATGSRPLVPRIPGLDRVKPYFLNTLADAKRIRNDLRQAHRVLIVGAGFVGLEMAFNLRKNGLNVTVVEKAARILPAQLDAAAARIIAEGLEAEGIQVVLNTSVSAVRPRNSLKRLLAFNGPASQVDLENGSTLEADMLILAVGSRPNLDFLEPGQLEGEQGILVDKHLMTSVPDVYAAGDVVESVDGLTGKHSLSPIWPNAVIQGEYAAANMVGLGWELDRLVGMQNAAEFREIPLICMGQVEGHGPEYEEVLDFRPAHGIYRKILFRDDRIIGMLYLGDISQSGVIGALLKAQTPVGHLKQEFLKPNFGYTEIISE